MAVLAHTIQKEPLNHAENEIKGFQDAMADLSSIND